MSGFWKQVGKVVAMLEMNQASNFGTKKAVQTLVISAQTSSAMMNLKSILALKFSLFLGRKQTSYECNYSLRLFCSFP
jgi:hypothetical protein